MNLTRSTRALHLALGALAIAAIGAVAVPAPARAQTNRQYPVERVDRSTRTLTLGPAGSIDVRNVSGEIAVTAGSGAAVMVEIVKRSRGRSDADAAQGLDRVQATVDQQGTHAALETHYPTTRGQSPFSVEVTYTITAPPGTSVTAENVSGGVTIKAIRGDISANVVSGAISISGAARISRARSVSGGVTIADLDGDGDLAAATVSGDVRLDRVKARHVSAEVVSGEILVRDARCDSVQLKSLSGSVEYSGTLSASGRYELQSHSGQVRFLPTNGTGFSVRATTFSGDVVVGRGLTLQNVSLKTRQSLEGTIGGGGATVQLTTFSGGVEIGPR